MAALASISRGSVFGSLHGASKATYLRRPFSSDSRLVGYYQLLQSTDRDKVRKIAESFLSEEARKAFVLRNTEVSQKELVELVAAIEKVVKIPMEFLDISKQNQDAIHFQANRTFINLPYSEKVSKWPDRTALQSLIRDKFRLLFETGDLVLIPGCADGQIVIDIQAQAHLHGIELDSIAVDFNDLAMKLGYCTMKSYGIPNKTKWVQADVASQPFFNWLSPQLVSRPRHQIVTLIQPSLTESSLLSFLTKSSNLAHQTHSQTTVVMPVLLEDHQTKWFQDYEKEVDRALQLAKKANDTPQLIWNKTAFGREVLRLNAAKTGYVPQQYFIDPQAIPEIQKTTGYSEAAHKVFEGLSSSKAYTYPNDPRIISSAQSKRIFCVWEAK